MVSQMFAIGEGTLALESAFLLKRKDRGNDRKGREFSDNNHISCKQRLLIASATGKLTIRFNP